MFELMDGYSQNAVIKVLGVGGGGGNAVKHMVSCGIEGVDFICANTDSQALQSSTVRTALQIGCNITKGLGAGADPEVGRQAAMEDRDRIQEVIEGSDMLFITAGLGGGTGTGAAPIAAQVARDAGALTVGVVTRPFRFEGRKRCRLAGRPRRRPLLRGLQLRLVDFDHPGGRSAGHWRSGWPAPDEYALHRPSAAKPGRDRLPHHIHTDPTRVRVLG